MTETEKNKENQKLDLAQPKKLELNKTIETGQVRQNFSHGRSKMVVVEVKKKRSFQADAGGRMSEVKHKPLVFETPVSVEDLPVVEEEAAVPTDEVVAGLTTEERLSRAKALEESRMTEVNADTSAPQEKEIDGATESQMDEKETEGRADQKEEDVDRPLVENSEKTKAKSERPIGKVLQEDLIKAEMEVLEDERKGRGKKGAKVEGRRLQGPSGGRRGEPRRRAGKLTISEALAEQEGRQRSLASVKRQREKEREKAVEARSEGKKVIREVIIPEGITIQELANRMAEQVIDVTKILLKMGLKTTVDQVIDADTAELVVGEFGHNYKRVAESDVEIGLKSFEDQESNLELRAPVVTIMGHVDHGKTSLLDALRKTDVALHEAGGITQHIGAYQVTLSSGAKITFLDTPGHAAFSEIRSRGAKVTDIVVLCVAADDGIMPQTVEAIRHAQAASVPIIVAINKIDKPGANAGKVRTDLLQHNIQVEDVGGDVLNVEVSALNKLNLEKLEEAILLQAELLDLKANPNRPAEGVIVESKIDQGRGAVSTVLVQRGTLKVGDIIVAGKEWGKVRAMFDALGSSLKLASPSVPVEVLGVGGAPKPGDEVSVVGSESHAREICEFRRRRERDVANQVSSRGTLEQMFERIKEGEADVLPVLIKADVHGSAEAIVNALEKLGTDEIRAHVLHSAVGGINESDITLARASAAPIIGFNVRANTQAKELAVRENVEIRYYSLIYNLIDDFKKLMSGMLAPEIKETFLGNASIQEVFAVSKVGKAAGCLVTEGQVKRGSKVRLIRDEVVVHEGELSQLKRFKDDVQEVSNGTECGMAFLNYTDLQAGDVIECFDVEEIARQL